MLPDTYKLKPWLKSESEITTMFLQDVRSQWVWYKVADIWNSIKYVDVVFFSRLYWAWSIEFKFLKTIKEPTYHTAISLCEPHQLRILHNVCTEWFLWYIGVYHQKSWYIYFYKFIADV